MRLDKLKQDLMYVQMLLAENKTGFILSFRSSRKRKVVFHATRTLTLLFVALLCTSFGTAIATKYSDSLSWLVFPQGFPAGVYTATVVVGILTILTYRLFIQEAIRIAKELGYGWDES